MTGSARVVSPDDGRPARLTTGSSRCDVEAMPERGGLTTGSSRSHADGGFDRDCPIIGSARCDVAATFGRDGFTTGSSRCGTDGMLDRGWLTDGSARDAAGVSRPVWETTGSSRRDHDASPGAR
ncbi:hypothetical protein IMZ29_22095 [Achromobacter sp. GG226]|uniref:hypothetical protein n=1 Tax=Verticiella alkaliphila TaxID=2779529 RepID=UPI001C0C9CC1|nr:hypothetical protein [Verticiella sp. GG226]MBU4613133.1 hypothetical protein [Verticiella sp. GG226]